RSQILLRPARRRARRRALGLGADAHSRTDCARRIFRDDGMGVLRMSDEAAAQTVTPAPAPTTELLHFPTIEAVRRRLAALRGEVQGIVTPHVEVKEAAGIVDVVVAALDEQLAAMMTPPCAACAAKKSG